MLVLACAALAACSTRDPYNDILWYYRPEPGSEMTPREQSGPYMLGMFHGEDGAPLTWTDVSAGVRWADIVIVGEQHDDANAHLVQTTLVEETMVMWPGSTLCMEMLERNEQPLVDAYMAGTLDKEEFIKQTESADWAGKGSWVKFYQPMIDAARTNGGKVVAANAPRAFVRQARTEGYEALAALPPDQRAQFELPADAPPETYRQRFKAFMTENGNPPTDEELDTMLRSQRVWDATMADSIVKAYKALPRNAKVVHVVGQFHSEYDGGLVSEIQARDGSARILTISVQKGAAYALRDEDRGKADIVMYGAPKAPSWTALQSWKKPVQEKPAETSEQLPEWGKAY